MGLQHVFTLFLRQVMRNDFPAKSDKHCLYTFKVSGVAGRRKVGGGGGAQTFFQKNEKQKKKKKSRSGV